MNLKEAIELIDPEIEIELKEHIASKLFDDSDFEDGVLRGRLSQMKREVEVFKIINEAMVLGEDYINTKIYETNEKRIEALNILIKHLEEVLK